MHQINELPDDVLPRQLKVAAQHVRLIGNDAAHVRAVSADDVTSLVSFVHLVLQQLYILPHELAQQTRTIQPQHMPGAPAPTGVDVVDGTAKQLRRLHEGPRQPMATTARRADQAARRLNK